MAASDTPEQMLAALTENYVNAAVRIDAAGIIPSGDAMYLYYRAVRPEGETVYRDTFHADLGVGRYLLGCVWYQTLCDRDIKGNTFRDFDVPVSEAAVLLAQDISREAIDGFGTLEI